MTIIYIARHGQNEDNAEGILNGHRDKPLTAIGRGQAKELGVALKGSALSFSTVYSSPLSRAFETAEIATEIAGLKPPNVHELLIERDFGIMSGKRTDQIEEICGTSVIKTDTITYFLDPEGAETFPQLLERAETLLIELKEKHPDETLLLVTHGDIGKMLYAQFYGLPWKSVLTDFHFGNCELLPLKEGADPNKPHIVSIKQHNH